MTIRVHVVPHTHWDREWHLPFQRFRGRLVHLGDLLLDMLDDEPNFAFTLDGQMAAVEDYLEIRPEARQRLADFVGSGRLAVGPWLILLDEFLPSGEAIVRNLELGTRAAAELGGRMPVGYLPDMFGHVAQMPQILRQAGLAHAVLWRGVPHALDGHAFAWAAPDGSVVRVEYLVGGYGNAAGLLAHPRGVDRALELFEENVGHAFGDADRLAMFGTDHQFPSPGSMAALTAADPSRHAVTVTTLSAYLDETVPGGLSAPEDLDALPRWDGELRSSARANVLMGVLSTNVHVKAAAARAERALARYAEPWQTLHGGRWPDVQLDLAWHKVVECSAHDSVTACSRDEVATQVRVRYGEAEQIADGIVEHVLGRAAAAVPQDGVLVANPSPTDRGLLVSLEVPDPGDDEWALELADGRRVACQQERVAEEVMLDTSVPRSQATHAFRLMHGRELFGGQLVDVAVEADGRRVSFVVDDIVAGDHLDVAAARERVETELGEDADEPWSIRIVRPRRRRLTASIPVGPLGMAAARPVVGRATLDTDPVRADGARLSNGKVSVTATADGLLDISGETARLTGVGRIVDGGEAGDTYNHAAPATDRVVDEPTDVQVDVMAAGPIVGRLRITRTYDWPVGLVHDATARQDTTRPVAVTMEAELRTDEPFVRITTTFDNAVRDHRVRLHVPVGSPTDASHAQGQFAVVTRGLDPTEEGHGEVGTPTHPARGFVAAGNAAVLLEHVTAYEVVDDGREAALTLVRATGMLSRNTNANREEPAGPEIEVEHAQCQGPLTTRIAVLPFTGTWHDAGVAAAAERFAHPGRTLAGTAGHGAPLPPSLDGLRLDADHHVTVSSIRRRDDLVEVRLVNEHPHPATASLGPGVTEATQVDLLGEVSGRATGDDQVTTVDGRARVELGPWRIVTVWLSGV